MMSNQRSSEKELLDLGPDYYTTDEYEHCMKMLFRVNKLLGYFSSTVKILKRQPKDASLLEIGCGGGLFLLQLARRFPTMAFKGVDISEDAIHAANKEKHTWQHKYPTHHVTFEKQLESDLALTANSVDIVLSTLVCHHLSDNELVGFLKNTLNGARNMVIIHDLHRHKIAEWFFGLFSPLIFRNRLITHDGVISIRRGFIRSDWEALLKKAEIQHYQLSWCFPFRWRLILCKNSDYSPGI